MTSLARNPVALLTGGTTGIGLVACKQLATKGIDVIFTSRSVTKGEGAISEIRKHVSGNSVKVRYIIMDLSDLTSVSKACDELLSEKELRLDYLILNAGVMGNPTVKESEKKSIDQIESIVAVKSCCWFFFGPQTCTTS